MKKNRIFIFVFILLALVSGCGKEETSMKSAADLCNMDIGTISGSVGSAYCIENGLDTDVYTSAEAAAFYLAAGESEALLVETELVARILDTYDTVKEYTDFEPIEYAYCILYNAENTDIKYLATVVITEASKDSAFAKLSKGFRSSIGQERNEYKTDELSGGEGTLRIGYVRDLASVLYADSDGSYSGVGFELVKRMAQKKNQSLQVVVYESEAQLQSAVLNGSVDICFTTTDTEVKKGLGATDPIFTFSLQLLTSES